eukprot:1180162-Prorocentrum_minimum.AAC.3
MCYNETICYNKRHYDVLQRDDLLQREALRRVTTRDITMCYTETMCYSERYYDVLQMGYRCERRHPRDTLRSVAVLLPPRQHGLQDAAHPAVHTNPRHSAALGSSFGNFSGTRLPLEHHAGASPALSSRWIIIRAPLIGSYLAPHAQHGMPTIGLDTDMQCSQKIGGELNSPAASSIDKGLMYVRVDP